MIFLWLNLGCDPTETDTAAVFCADRPVVTWDGWSHSFFTTYCLSCHSVNNTEHRWDAPVGVNFDFESDVEKYASRVRVRVLDDGTMPIGGGVYEDDLYLLDTYLTCTLGD